MKENVRDLQAQVDKLVKELPTLLASDDYRAIIEWLIKLQPLSMDHKVNMPTSKIRKEFAKHNLHRRGPRPRRETPEQWAQDLIGRALLYLISLSPSTAIPPYWITDAEEWLAAQHDR